MRTDVGREDGRPRGAVLWPLGLLLTALAGGFGMWHALMHDGDPRASYDRLVQGTPR